MERYYSDDDDYGETLPKETKKQPKPYVMSQQKASRQPTHKGHKLGGCYEFGDEEKGQGPTYKRKPKKQPKRLVSTTPRAKPKKKQTRKPLKSRAKSPRRSKVNEERRRASLLKKFDKKFGTNKNAKTTRSRRLYWKNWILFKFFYWNKNLLK